MLNLYHGTIDVWIVLDAGWLTEVNMEIDLGDRANLVYFTPEFSHKTPYRTQKLEGEFDPNRPVIISDIGFWYGETFKETFNVVKTKGYNPNDIFGFFKCGYTGAEKMDDSPFYQIKVFNRADKISKIIKENNKTILGK